MSCIHLIAEDTCSLCAGIKQMGGTKGYSASASGSLVFSNMPVDNTNYPPLNNSIFCYAYLWFADHEFDSAPYEPKL